MRLQLWLFLVLLGLVVLTECRKKKKKNKWWWDDDDDDDWDDDWDDWKKRKFSRKWDRIDRRLNNDRRWRGQDLVDDLVGPERDDFGEPEPTPEPGPEPDPESRPGRGGRWRNRKWGWRGRDGEDGEDGWGISFNFGIDGGDDGVNPRWDTDFKLPKWLRWLGRDNRRWWEGPNVCVQRSEKNETVEDDVSHHAYVTRQYCDNTESTHKCTTSVTVYGIKKTFTVLYECCHGFEREKGRTGCTKELNLVGLLSTAEKLKATKFADAVRSVQLADTLRTGNYTLFVPTDEVFTKYMGTELPTVSPSLVLLDGVQMDEMVTDVQSLLQGHVMQGRVKSSKFDDEVLLETLADSVKIRTNYYTKPKRLVTANCAKILSTDHEATNGIVHVVEKVLVPVTGTVMDVISKNKELSSLKTVLGQTGLVKRLKADGHYTILAPTDAAFAKLKPSIRAKLREGNGCLENILKYHIFPNTICSSIIEGNIRTANSLNSYTNLTRDGDGKLFANGAQIVATDIMGTNGVVHIIDEVLIPNEALSVLDIAEKEGASEILTLFEATGLRQTLENMKNFTLFLPTNKAVKEAINSTLRIFMIQSNHWAMKRPLLHHMVKPQVECRDMQDGKVLKALQLDDLPEYSLEEPFPGEITMKEYSSFPFGMTYVKTAQCARILKQDLQGCNGVVHIVDKVLIPPMGSIMATLRREDPRENRFSVLINLLEKTGLSETLTEEGTYTLFAPTNEAFRTIEDDFLNDTVALKSLLHKHVLPDIKCCAGIFKRNMFLRQKEKTLDNSSIRLSRNQRGIPTVQNAYITTCDKPAINGIIHVVDRVFMDSPFEFRK